MHYGTLIGDLFDVVERIDNSADRQRTQNEKPQLPATEPKPQTGPPSVEEML
jgi:hypothetical protein